MPIGLLSVARYEQAAVALEQGDALVCFSDGITEATNSAGEIWEESVIKGLLREARGASAQEITALLVREADAFTGDAEQADDMTVVTLRVV
jgi:sigma-B regulation protein RsbU (phosphoserine phosphatase)